MKINAVRLNIGKASLAAVCVAAACTMAVGVTMSRPAMAQGAGKVSMNDISFAFGPVHVSPVDPGLPLASESMEVGLLLPAVQKVREAASRMRLVGDGWVLDVPVMGSNVPTHSFFKIWFDTDATGQLMVHVANRGGETRDMAVPSSNVSVIIVPEVQSDRRVYEAETASARHHSIGSVVLADGSPRPVLIGLLLPAVQKIR